jgi:murein DD-endopeptidase MepM/ murein hydrolase activator NlpD
MGNPLSREDMHRGATWRYPSGTLHAAYDYTVPIHTPVFAVRRGKILKVVDNIKNLPVNVEGKSGDPANFILLGIKYNGATATVVYAHLSPNVLVQQGDVVKEGQQIARSGHNGHSTGPHLHVSAVTGHATHNFPELSDLA